MNNRGQSLITFVLILPLICLFLAFFIDSSLSMMEKHKLDGIITDNMKSSLENDIRDIEKIKAAIKENEDANITVTIEEDILKINVESRKKSIFGKMLNFSWYDLKFNYCGSYIDKSINKKCG